MKRTAAAAILCAAICAVAFSEQGQGPVKEGPINTKGLQLGEYWYGAQIDKRDLIGKIVLVEIWGS